MIRINLLPKKPIGVKPALVEQGAVAIISVVVVVLILFLFQINVKGNVDDLSEKITSTKEELKKLEKSEAQIEELKASELVIQQKIDVIKTLEKRKTGPVLMLDEVASRIPEKMWLTQLKSQRALLSMEGVAIDNETIAQFMTNLENGGQFENVELQVAQETKIEDFMFKKFAISSTITVMKEVEKEETKEAAEAKGKKKKEKKKKKKK